MAREVIDDFSDDSLAEIAKSVRTLRWRVQNVQALASRLARSSPTHEVRTGIMKAKPGQTYPADGCVLPVQFQDAHFPENVGTCEAIQQNPWPSKFIIGRTYSGEYIPEGRDVIIVKLPSKKGRRWWILDSAKHGHGRPVLLSPVTCFKSWDPNPQPMFLHVMQNCQWVKTEMQVLAVDPNDCNFLIKGETQWARLKIGCESDGKPIYELVGSRGLFRRVKAKADIACEGIGEAEVHDYEGHQEDCGSAQYEFSNAEWRLVKECNEGCKPEEDPNNIAFDPPPPEDAVYWTDCVPISGENNGCQTSVKTECLIDICNAWGARMCIPIDSTFEARYLKRGIWSPDFRRGAWYLATLIGNMCPDSAGTQEITGATPLDYCESPEELLEITEATNTFGRAAEAGDTVLIKRDTTVCDIKFHVVQVMAKCRDVPMTADCDGDGVYLEKNACESIDSKVQRKVAIETCEPEPDTVPQILLESATVYRSQLVHSQCSLSVLNYPTSLCVLSGGDEGTPQTSGSVTLTKSKAITSMALDKNETSGIGGGSVCDPKLLLYWSYFLQLAPCTDGSGNDEFDLDTFDYVSNMDMTGCPTWENRIGIGFGDCGAGSTENADCDPCPAEGSGA